MVLEGPAERFANAVWYIVLALNLLGAGLIVGELVRFGRRGPAASPEPGLDVSGTRRLPVPAAVVSRALPQALAAGFPWGRILRQAPGAIWFVNRALDQWVTAAAGTVPAFSHGEIRVQEEPGGAAVFSFRLSYAGYARTVRRILWIALLLVTLPNVMGMALDSRAQAGLAWLRLFHVAWPFLVWFLYRLNLRAGREAMWAVADRASELAQGAG